MLSKDQRKELIQSKGFVLVDDSGYKNMDSKILVRCPHGHEFTTSIAAVKHVSFECPKCNHEIVYDAKGVPPKEPGIFRVIAFDQATEHFGLSVFDSGKLVYYSLYTFTGTLDVRLVSITKLIRDIVLKLWEPDFICFEDIQYEQKGILTFKVLAQLIGIITVLCKEKNIPYEIVSPNVWRKYCGTAGKNRREEKLLSVAKVKEGYNITVGDDVAEAILIGRYAVKMHSPNYKIAFGTFNPNF